MWDVISIVMWFVVRLVGAVAVVMSIQLTAEVESFVRVLHFLEMLVLSTQSLFVEEATIFSIVMIEVVVVIKDFWGVVLHDSVKS